MNGVWSLYVSDDVLGDVGTLLEWDLILSYDPQRIHNCVSKPDGCLDWAPGVDCSEASLVCDDRVGEATCF